MRDARQGVTTRRRASEREPRVGREGPDGVQVPRLRRTDLTGTGHDADRARPVGVAAGRSEWAPLFSSLKRQARANGHFAEQKGGTL
jgi:hypothetical protein